ncbi:YqeG family HAD IIIA-type phosphatase [Trichocoleus sp. ST-U3]|uniref:YqeG family HAD IIIA-type phosphatase n=1 Tax=Coleofasciculus sp. FACHB-542 TaxID=2692787 RepID=UPI001684ECB5|nr:YqeG family HAD IIIA-type phosphatase [Coleofasciculus sp. FACHB-542]MBD2086094.1 YqeG family HAD IIIA-type phosphatase [Coleofasciculus sp. FACHB-542]
MSWVTRLQPDLILGRPIVSLTPDLLQQYHLKGLVLDVDDTLVPLKAAEASEELVEWVKEIRQVATLWLVSNNLSENRISGIARSLNLPYITSAAKPSRRKLRQAVTAMNLPVEQVGMVGDRLFTDVLAGNRLGMFTILVEPMLDPALAVRSYPVRTFEVWVSQALGVSLTAKQQNLKNPDKS